MRKMSYIKIDECLEKMENELGNQTLLNEVLAYLDYDTKEDILNSIASDYDLEDTLDN